jgi:hypothetical protein
MKERQLSIESILPRLKSELPDILLSTPVMLAYLYGSLVDGTVTPFSDVDIALLFGSRCVLSGYERMQLEFDIASEIEHRCNLSQVDVRGIDHAPLTVQGDIVTRGILLFSRDETFRVDYEVYTRKMYLDFLPVADLMRSAFFKSLRKEGLSLGQT